MFLVPFGIKRVSLLCEQAESKLRRKGWHYYRDDCRRSWESRRWYGVRALLRNIVSYLEEETVSIMEQSTRQEDDLSPIPTPILVRLIREAWRTFEKNQCAMKLIYD